MHSFFATKNHTPRELLDIRRSEMYKWIAAALAEPRKTATPAAQQWVLTSAKSSAESGWLELFFEFENGSTLHWHIDFKDEVRIDLVLSGELNAVARKLLPACSQNLMPRADWFAVDTTGAYEKLRYVFVAPYLLECASHQEAFIFMLEDAMAQLAEVLLFNVDATNLADLPTF